MNKLTEIKEAHSEIKNSRQEYVLTGEYEEHVGYLLSLLEEKDKALERIAKEWNDRDTMRNIARKALNTSSNNEGEQP